MHPKDLILAAQKTDIIFYWKCPTTTAQLNTQVKPTGPSKKEFQAIEIKPPVPSLNHHISTNHPKAELKDFTIIDRDTNTLHH